MTDVFDYIDLGLQQKLKRDGIINGILDAIENDVISKGDSLPSVNKFIQKLGVARMTVVKALNVLKERGIIVSEDKVGYFVKDANIKRELKVFLFFTEFNSYHEVLYNKIIEGTMGQNITIDLYFHHCNPKIFKSVLQENLGLFGLYIITGFDGNSVKPLLSRIPKNKLLQILRPPLLKDVASISQDFEFGLKKSLGKLNHLLRKYNRFILIFPKKKGHPEVIKTTFIEFCVENNMPCSVENKIRRDLIDEGIAFWVIEDSDLISLIKLIEEKGFRLRKEVGILSYNETPMKEIIRNGITVVSTDFNKIGRMVSAFITNRKSINEVLHPKIIVRNSL